MKDISQNDLDNNLKLVVASSGEFKVENKNFVFGEDFIIIGGPCRVESKEQMEAIAKNIKENGLKFMRAGAFKPCTFPYASTGMGEEGLKILKEVADKYGLISVSEVMAIDQIPLGEKYIDVFQIGARNMQNYNLLAAIGKTGKPVVLKRHPGASLRDLLGAAEWLLYNGCKYLLLCERGITAPYTHDKDVRWLLDFQIVPAVKRITKIPIILDVSHSAGTRAFASYLTTAAAGSRADGLMIEIHENPDKSQSDKDQIIDLEAFSWLIKKVEKIVNVLNKKIV
jgi:3-deoxy-7-phosphoheptulonate synthase